MNQYQIIDFWMRIWLSNISMQDVRSVDPSQEWLVFCLPVHTQSKKKLGFALFAYLSAINVSSSVSGLYLCPAKRTNLSRECSSNSSWVNLN